jgi:hypothetical protein
MTTTIWKYELEIDDLQTIEMPGNYKGTYILDTTDLLC